MNLFAKVCKLLGCFCVISAMLLTVYNIRTDYEAGQHTQIILEYLKEQIPQESDSDTLNDADITPLDLDGSLYIGIITIPAIGIELPVLQEWSYPNLKIAPCCYQGTPETNDFIIAAHNYTSHFGNLKHLSENDTLYFTAVNGKTYSYFVSAIQEIAGTHVTEMTDGEWDLTLFTCTYNGQSRVTIRCIRY